MMHRLMILAAMFGGAVAVQAQQQPIAESPTISGLIADLEAGRVDAAVAKISLVESLSGRPRLVTTSRQFVARMRDCKLRSRKTVGPTSFAIEKTEWKCADGSYEVSFWSEPGNPYVTIAEFSDPARIAELKARPVSIAPPAPPAPMVPRTISPEEQSLREAARAQLLNSFGSAVTAGNMASASAYIRPTTRFILGYRDVANKTTVVEMDGEGLPEGTRQLAWIVKNLGRPASTDCKKDGQIDRCLWKFSRPGRSLLMFLGASEDRVYNVQFLYVNEKVIRLNSAALQAGGR